MSEQMSNCEEITVPADLRQLPAVVTLIDSMLNDLQCPAKSRIHVKITVDEIFSNIILHANLLKGEMVTVCARTETDPSAIEITFTDKGRPFDPLSVAEPDVTASAQKRPVGGLGLFMVRRMMDTVKYEYVNDKNILTVRKNL